MSFAHETILYVDFQALEHNYKYLKNKLNSQTKIIAVVKAYAYGHGDIDVGVFLEKLGASYLWVADFEEGVSLREGGVSIPIIVANPGIKSFKVLYEYKLQPVIYNEHLLDFFGFSDKMLDVHLKFNTGMNRFGFEANQVNKVADKVKMYSNLNLISVCSHLSATDNYRLNEFTLNQLKVFKSIKNHFLLNTNIKPLFHVLNSNGVLNFSSFQEDLVRLGIGLYGINKDKNLRQVGRLESTISEIRKIQKGERIGYQASFIAKKKMIIAVVPVGYADGLNRKLNKGGWLIVQNKKAAIVGDISMDSCVIDITGINAKIGDSVEVFGNINSVIKLSSMLHTIPYEILATLNRRIKRIYLQ